MTADRNDHIVQVCEGHKQIQKLRKQGARLTWRDYHTTANWLYLYIGTKLEIICIALIY